jgi:hypothetical protein
LSGASGKLRISVDASRCSSLVQYLKDKRISSAFHCHSEAAGMVTLAFTVTESRRPTWGGDAPRAGAGLYSAVRARGRL